jgi:hypothetical protein
VNNNAGNFDTQQVGGYEAPALVVHGSVADITGAALPGSVADHTLPAGALSISLTISL